MCVTRSSKENEMNFHIIFYGTMIIDLSYAHVYGIETRDYECYM